MSFLVVRMFSVARREVSSLTRSATCAKLGEEEEEGGGEGEERGEREGERERECGLVTTYLQQ